MSRKQMIDRAMAYLSQGGCSEQALRARLEDEFAQEPNLNGRIRETLARLHQLDLINDARIARQIAERFSHKGNVFIIHQLKESGIDEATIQSALAFIGSEYQRALQEAQRERLNWEDDGLPELQTRIMRLLSGRSFSYQTLCQVMDTLFNKQLCTSSFINDLSAENEEPSYLNTSSLIPDLGHSYLVISENPKLYNHQLLLLVLAG